MQFFKGMNISATGIEASRMRMEAASMNLANAESSSPDPNGAYRARRVKLGEAVETFQESLWLKSRPIGVQAEEFQTQEPPQVHFDPTHPDADENGLVYLANVDVTSELSELMAARRAYEAGLAAYTQSRETFRSTLEILRS